MLFRVIVGRFCNLGLFFQFDFLNLPFSWYLGVNISKQFWLIVLSFAAPLANNNNNNIFIFLYFYYYFFYFFLITTFDSSDSFSLLPSFLFYSFNYNFQKILMISDR
jgi:hypothetical protein